MDTYIGFDTSCYTTSFAAVNGEGCLVLDHRTVLEVNKGSRGLRQSEGVFQHIRNISAISDKLYKLSGHLNIMAAAASVKPRPLPQSYMPVFTVGENAARLAAGVAGVPFFETTHQENHLMAGLWSAGGPKSDRFLTVHLSGGTTELLETVRRGTDFDIKIVGGTGDISAGQFVDRVGVAMGLPFPSGLQMERLAGQSDNSKAMKIPCFAEGSTLSFSGPETRTKRMVEAGEDKAQIARAVFKCIALGLESIVSDACARLHIGHVLMVGGVSSNKYIREHLEAGLSCKLYFPEPGYCSDNAVGAALIALEKYRQAHSGQ